MLQNTLHSKTVAVNATLGSLVNQKKCKTDNLREDIKFVTELIAIDKFVAMHPNQLETLQGLTGVKFCLMVARHKLA